MRDCPDDVILENRPCPNGCPPVDRLVLEGHDRLHGIPGQFQVVSCMNCGLMRTNPRPSPETIGAYYPNDYGPYQTSDAPVTPSGAGFRRRMRRLLGLETRVVPDIPPGRMLEIGCANGAYMEQMRREGWLAEGIEFSEAIAQQAREKGFKVQAATVETAEAPSEPVDVVAAWMVLEHLHEPVNALSKVREWVKSDGYLIASVPDAGALERRIFGNRWYALQLPTHLYHYTPETIEAVLSAAGWEVVRVRWQCNCNNLLCSLEYFAKDRGMNRLLRGIQWFRTSRTAGKARVVLAWLLGVLRQSGRMEIWARPATSTGRGKP